MAAVVTEFAYREHAHVLLENFLEPYYFNGQVTDGGVDVAALYVDQFPQGRDMAHEVSRQYNIPIFPNVPAALKLGGKSLAVDGVIAIGEHGDYTTNERGQKMYPRKRFFDDIVAVFRESNRVVPLFNDKHLSYRWDWCREMVETARLMKIPFMAGSSVPLAHRRPPLELPKDAVIDEAVSIHAGPLEMYDFHGLEVLQSLVETRRGGETGVRRVEQIEGDAVWDMYASGRRTLALAEEAMRSEFGRSVGPLRDFVEPRDGKRHEPRAILIDYRDGLRATVLALGLGSTRWNFACRLKDDSRTFSTYLNPGPWENRNLFKALAHAIQSMVKTGRPPYAVERTLLTSGMLAAAMDSRFQNHKPVETPQLDVAYHAEDFSALRENGDSWKMLAADAPEPRGMDSAKNWRK